MTPETTERPASLSDPLITKLLEIRDDHFNIPEDTKYINDYIISEIKRRGMDDNESSYKELLKSIDNDEDNIYNKLKKMTEIVRAKNKAISIVKEREDLMKKDPKDMTANELKRYIENE